MKEHKYQLQNANDLARSVFFKAPFLKVKILLAANKIILTAGIIFTKQIMKIVRIEVALYHEPQAESESCKIVAYKSVIWDLQF
jgi:hypothetical protein